MVLALGRLFGPSAGCGGNFCIPWLVTFDVPLVLREVLIDPNEAEHLPSWSLEVQVGVRCQ